MVDVRTAVLICIATRHIQHQAAAEGGMYGIKMVPAVSFNGSQLVLKMAQC